jgi:hypothetical protein
LIGLALYVEERTLRDQSLLAVRINAIDEKLSSRFVDANQMIERIHCQVALEGVAAAHAD